MNHFFEELNDAVRSEPPALAVVLGSGLSELTHRLQNPISVSYADIVDMPNTSIAGHKGHLVFGKFGGKPILFFQGRFHYYEGHTWDAVLRPIRLAHELGAHKLLVTNAAGGIRDDLTPGCVMLIDGALDWTRTDWMGMNKPKRDLFDSAMIANMRTAADQISMPLPSGVYVQMLGPCYETPAEIRALRHCGADAVGMSTVRELVEANALGMRCIGLSLITNCAAGLSDGPLDHEEVLATATQRKHDLIALLERFAPLAG